MCDLKQIGPLRIITGSVLFGVLMGSREDLPWHWARSLVPGLAAFLLVLILTVGGKSRKNGGT